jgi:hypothetical protein
MAAPKVNVNSVININLPSSVSDGFNDPEVKGIADQVALTFNNLLGELEKYLGITQKDITTWNNLGPSDTLLTHQLRRLYVVASENILLGDFINLHNVAGVLNARKANGAAGNVKPARGFCSTAGGIAAGAIGEVILQSGIVAIAGVVPGQDVWISATPGLAGGAALVGAGQLEQYLGTGVATNLVFVNIAMGAYLQH